ncbi:MAG: hypothetical protein ACR2OZ_08075 [Verrucomicrobiales bacterium]
MRLTLCPKFVLPFVGMLIVNATPSRAALTAYDGFNYVPGSALAGQNGGFGFSGAWAPGGFNAPETVLSQAPRRSSRD